MPRRRLHGETQKRRKKKVTRDLKRTETIVRPQVTQAPAPFERSEQVGREDLEFLEAMRELEVRRIARKTESTQRREAVSRVQFQVDEADLEGFGTHMAHMGVQPLGGAKARKAKGQGGKESQPPAPQPSPARTMPAQAPSLPVPAKPIPAGPLPAEPIPAAASAKADPPAHPAASGLPGSPGAGRDSLARSPVLPGAGFTTFEDAEGGGEDMAALLEEADFDPGGKFEGAPTPPEARDPGAKVASPRQAEHLEPEDALDLHGKTQEEAIAMVQNFLLTCHRRRLHHVLIITGKGLNSGSGGPVLKEAVHHWLQRNAERFARSFFTAPARHGGEGVIWVVLR